VLYVILALELVPNHLNASTTAEVKADPEPSKG
jgi:hypothetical protein